MDHRARTVTLLGTLALIALNLVAFNGILANWSTGRVDLTEDRLFSITPATKQLLQSLEDEVTIRGYFSKRTHPKLAPLVPRIEDMLDEYRSISRGKVFVEIVDPGEDEEAEQEANSRFGVESTPFRLASKYESGIVNAYFAIVIQHGDQYIRYGFDDLIEVEPLPDGDIDVRLANLEYDLTRGIKKVVFGFRSTEELFERLPAPARLTALMSPDALPEIFQDVPEAVRQAAEELEEKGGDKFEFEEIDPTSDPALADELYARYGARPMTLGLFSDDKFYLQAYLTIGDAVEQIVLAGEGVTAARVREAIESALRRHTPGFLRRVGVVAPDPSIPPEVMRQLQMQGRMPPQPPPEFRRIKEVLREEYEVVDVQLDSATGIPDDVDTLLVLEPKNLDEKAVFALDQYLMRGGRIVLCAGRYDVDLGPSGLSLTPIDTGLEDWLAHWGVTIEKTLVLDDRNQPMPIPEFRETPLGTIRTWRLAPYPYLVDVTADGLVHREVTAKLRGVGIFWGSPIVIDEEKVGEREVIPLLKSSERSWTDDDPIKARYVDYVVPEEGLEPRLLAVAIGGRFESYFKDHPVPGRDEEGEDGEASASDVVLETSPETRMVVIGDSAFVSDLVASAVAQDPGAFAENLAFVQNTIDWINEDNDLLAIRARGTGLRRIERISSQTEAMIEIVNYAVPAFLLVALGLARWGRRRYLEQAAPVRGGAASVRAAQEG